MWNHHYEDLIFLVACFFDLVCFQSYYSCSNGNYRVCLCGGRTFRRDKENPLAEYMDIRREEAWFIPARPNFVVDPDFVGDFRDIPRPDNSYKLVVFDPPHLKNAGEKSWLKGKYGRLNKDTCPDDLRQGFRECMRVLELHGTLVFKRNENQVKLTEVLKAIDYEPLFGTRSGRNNDTIRLVFMKIPKEEYNQ